MYRSHIVKLTFKMQCSRLGVLGNFQTRDPCQACEDNDYEMDMIYIRTWKTQCVFYWFTKDKMPGAKCLSQSETSHIFTKLAAYFQNQGGRGGCNYSEHYLFALRFDITSKRIIFVFIADVIEFTFVIEISIIM